MSDQMIFKRYELKYLLTRQQQARILSKMEDNMARDEYGHSSVRNIYFDTDTFRLARHSIEHPAYKEKLRIRSYGKADPEAPVFVELKKKYQSVVYKRRLPLPEQQAMGWLCGRLPLPVHSQIAEEVAYFCSYYQTLRPVVFLSYEREAFYSRDGDDFRVTFDENLLARRQELSLNASVGGTPLLAQDQVLMEIKTAGGIPLWMSHLLAQQQIYQSSFSKYGTAYKTLIFPHYEGGLLYA